MWWNEDTSKFHCIANFITEKLLPISSKLAVDILNHHPRQQSSWGQHGAHLGPVGPRWAPCWPHEPCYRGLSEIQLYSWQHAQCILLFIWNYNIGIQRTFCKLIETGLKHRNMINYLQLKLKLKLTLPLNVFPVTKPLDDICAKFHRFCMFIGTAGWFCCSPPRTVGVLLPLAPALISSPGMLLDPPTNILIWLPLGVAGKVLLPFENVSLVGLLPFDRWSSCSVTGYRSAAICNCIRITGTRYCTIIIFFRFAFVQDIWHMVFFV